MDHKPLPARLFEAFFCIGYLVFVVVAFVHFVSTHQSFPALMALFLGTGDAFHLVPRILNNLIGHFDKDEVYLGLGNMISSITMTVFYVIMAVYFDGARFGILMIVIYVCAIARIALCLFPQNNWLHREGNHEWSIIRNLPFVIVGLGVTILCLLTHRFIMALLIVLSFGFYLPVVLWAKQKPMIGMLMIPKTICYILMLILLW